MKKKEIIAFIFFLSFIVFSFYISYIRQESERNYMIQSWQDNPNDQDNQDDE